MIDTIQSSDSGCLEMYGAHIRLCIKDYADVHKHIDAMEKFCRNKKNNNTTRKSHFSQMIHNYYTAKQFIFGGGLQDAVEKFGLPLDPGYIQREAREYAEKGNFNYCKKDVETEEVVDEPQI